MMNQYKKTFRLSVFIDYDNFAKSYKKKFRKKIEDADIWTEMSALFSHYYADLFINNDFEVVDHIGTYVCIGLSDNIQTQKEKDLKTMFDELDRKKGFIVKYASRKPPKFHTHKNGDGTTTQVQLGQEKGVDSEIICQMMMGAFLDHYDACVLVSDAADYIPAVSRIQDYFGKKVIQAGYRNSRVRGIAYAHIPLENADAELLMQAPTIYDDELAKTVANGLSTMPEKTSFLDKMPFSLFIRKNVTAKP